MSRTSVHHHNATAEGAAVAVVVVLALFGAILIAPGALLVFGADRALELALDRPQLWTFAGVASAALIGVLGAAARSFAVGARRHVLIAAGVTALMLVARFGLHAAWPRELWRAFTGLS